MKVCKTCHIEKDESEFYKTGYTRKDGHRSVMKNCKSCHYNAVGVARYISPERKEAYLAYQKDYRAEKRPAKHADRLSKLDELKTKPCGDCHSSFPPECMDFDHIDRKTKKFSISQAVGSGNNWKSILEEIAKCRLICANCHRIRTVRQQRRGQRG